uniref:Uncharacterized protein n=1 Tax=Arundo donax TaxID=35708 RepID=A0A0A9H069_ARUDO
MFMPHFDIRNTYLAYRAPYWNEFNRE